MEGKIIGLFLIALIGGLTGGFGLNYIIYQPQVQTLQNQVANLDSTLQGLLNMSGAGVNNQVQVSGTVSVTQTGTMHFTSYPNSSIKSSVPITNGQYSVLLVGGISYNIEVTYPPYNHPDYTLYVPLGVATFTANF